MSAAMTNCGALGWVTDRTGYRYDAVDPESGKPRPRMPASFLRLAADAAADPEVHHPPALRATFGRVGSTTSVTRCLRKRSSSASAPARILSAISSS